MIMPEQQLEGLDAGLDISRITPHEFRDRSSVLLDVEGRPLSKGQGTPEESFRFIGNGP